MKIDYVVYGDAQSRDGVNRKIAAQVDRWRASGHDVRVAYLSFSEGEEPALDADLFPFDGMSDRISATIALTRSIRERQPDLVYMRFDSFTPPLPSLLRGLPLVAEINGDDREETRLYARHVHAYSRLHWHATLPFVSGFVCVTRELIGRLGRYAAGRPVAVIANGVETVASPGTNRSRPGETSNRIAMLIGADPTPAWHGLDRVAELARTLPEYAFDLIGISGRSDSQHFPENITVHPRLPREQYVPLLENACAALGPLAIFRSGLDEASPLKVREYLVSGLPLITSHRDTDFPDDPWFIHRIPNRECDIAAEADGVRRWLDGIRGRSVPGEAVRHLHVDMKEAARLAFFERVLAGRSRRAAGP